MQPEANKFMISILDTAHTNGVVLGYAHMVSENSALAVIQHHGPGVIIVIFSSGPDQDVETQHSKSARRITVTAGQSGKPA